MNQLSEPVYVFWRHDLYPYVLGDKSDGRVRIKNGVVRYYIPSYLGYVTPLFVLDMVEGEKLAEALKQLKWSLDAAEAALQVKYNENLFSALSTFGIDTPDHIVGIQKRAMKKL